MSFQDELEFLSGRFFEYDIPKEKSYLLNYFSEEDQRAFLRYYMIFKDHKNFVHHTGVYVPDCTALRWAQRYATITRYYDKIRKELTEESMNIVSMMEMGKWPVKKMVIE